MKKHGDNDIIPEADMPESENLDDSVVAEENTGKTVKDLREKLKKAQAEAQEYLAGWQRAKADLINARRQDEKDKQEFVKFANQNLILELLPVVGSFEMAMANKEAWEKADKNWRMGVEYIYGQLKTVHSNHGAVELNPIGEKYDPARDETAGHEFVSDKSKDGVITSVIQKGYSLNGKVLKAPKVMVGEYKKEE